LRLASYSAHADMPTYAMACGRQNIGKKTSAEMGKYSSKKFLFLFVLYLFLFVLHTKLNPK